MVCAAAVLCCGCGGRGIELVDVRGRITLGGADMPAAGTLYFTAVDPADGNSRRPATAQFATDGTFRATSFDSGDGLIPGRYRVAVHCWEVAPSMGGPPAKSYIPDRYTAVATSKLELDVPAGQGSMRWDIDLEPQ
ncbi:MAG: hypothetical protein KDA41_21195 [Planctomycetales bacterium]|nr:hypothetical protein [Planctomycetales bacterium]